MSHDNIRHRIRLSLRTLSLIIVIELLNEFGDKLVFQHFGVMTSSLNLHLLKLAVALTLSIPVIAIWLIRDYQEMKSAQNKLDASMQDYGSLFDHNPDGVYLLDYNGNFINANPIFLKMTGFTIEELKHLPPFPFVSDGNRGMALKTFYNARNGEPQRYEDRILTRDNQELIVNLSYFPMYRRGKVEGVYAIAQDVTKRTHYERALFEAQSLLNSFIENTTDSIIIFDTDKVIKRANAGFENLYGWRIDEVVGREIPMVAPHEHMEEFDRLIDSVLQRQVVSSKETVRMTKEGRIFDVNTTISPITDSNGNVVALVGVSRDISRYKTLTRDLEETNARLKSLVEHTADAISIVNDQSEIDLVNPAWERLYGWTFTEVRGKPCPLSGERFDPALEGAVSTKEETYVRKDGTEVIVSVTASPIYSAHGRIIGAARISKDLTELRRAEEIMYGAEKLRIVAELAAGIAHEIRNPLTSIQGFIDLMKSYYDPKYLNILAQEVRRINEVTNEFMLLAKPQAKSKSFENVISIIDEVLTLMQTQTHMHSISVHKIVAQSLPPLLCVKGHIKQALINLLKNSIEALSDGGNIFVTAMAHDGVISLTIADDGPGMSEGILQRIGQPFYTTKERGTGLGLMVTYRIIHNHGGTIRVESEPNQGTSFEIELPRQDVARVSDDFGDFQTDFANEFVQQHG